MTPEQRAALVAQLGDTQPAHDSLLESFAESVANRREHAHDREDWFCLNLAAYMGERAGSVLRRLLDAEAETERLRTELERRKAEGRRAYARLGWCWDSSDFGTCPTDATGRGDSH